MVLAALLAVLAWQGGSRRGIEHGRELERNAAVAERAEAAAGRAGDEVALSRLAGERDMARATIDALRMELEQADQLVASERAELELYRRIGSDGVASGLAIDTLERRGANGDGANGGGDAPTVFVTLVQARGRDRVGGRIEVRAPGADPASLAPGPLLAETTFDLRFFETVTLPIGAVGEGFPPVIDIGVIPDGSRHEPFRRSYRREDIREAD